MTRTLRVCIAAIAAMSGANLTRAAVTDQRLYHLGEADIPPAVPGGATDPVTVDSVAGINATKVGLEFYRGTGLQPGSSLSMEFTNVDSRYEAAVVGGITDNVGIEAYVMQTATADSRFFYNGGVPFPGGLPVDGWGLGVTGGQYVGVLGGVGTIPTGVPVIPGVPVEMALVIDSGVTTVYINDVPVKTVTLPVVPVTATDSLVIGDFAGNASPPGFAGVVDEARIFTFAPGAFNPGTDLGPAAVPEPSMLPLLAMSSLAALRRRSRRRPASK